MKTFVIVNPNSAGGSTMKRWPSTSERLERAIGKFDYEFTNAEGVATLLASEAVKKGFEKIISVGGDGTLHEVVQGLFNDNDLSNPKIIVGMLPFGSGADFPKSFKFPNDIDEAIKRIKDANTIKVDVGKVSLKNHVKNKITQYLINIADVGLGGHVVERVNSSSKRLGGFATYLLSSVVSFARYEPKKIKMIADGETIEKSVTTVLIANGKYCGGGMYVAPPAEIDDGYFDVVIIEELPKWNLVSFLPKVYSGKLLSQPGVKYLKAKEITIESDEDVLINIDGEQPGITPMKVSVLPKILNFIV